MVRIQSGIPQTMSAGQTTDTDVVPGGPSVPSVPSFSPPSIDPLATSRSSSPSPTSSSPSMIPVTVQSMSNTQTEESFVILEHQPSTEADLDQFISGENSFVSLSTEELGGHLRSVLVENRQMEEVVRQNNAAFKEQLKILTEWKERMAKQESDHGEVVNRMKTEIEELKAQNSGFDKSGIKNESDNPKTKASPSNADNAKLTELVKKIEELELEARDRSRKDALMQKELHKLQVTLTDERKMSKELSRNLEFEKKRADSLEQASKPVQQNSTEEQNRVSASQIDSLTTRLLQTEEHLREEKGRTKVLNEKLKQMELEIEAIPILKAQVEVYQSDFNAERAARERIAGEKEELEKRILRTGDNLQFPALSGHSTERNETSQSDNRAYRVHGNSSRQLEDDILRCPKCQATFTQLEPLQAHVNDCLDRDF